MKGRRKKMEHVAKKTHDVQFILDESLSKYKGPECTPPKLRAIEKMFGKQVHH